MTQTAGRGQCGRPPDPIIHDRKETAVPRILDGRVSAGELAALRLAANGYTSRQIASRLETSEQAIHLRLRHATQSLGGRSRTHAVAIAIARGLICLDEIQTRMRPDRPARPEATQTGADGTPD